MLFFILFLFWQVFHFPFSIPEYVDLPFQYIGFFHGIMYDVLCAFAT